MAEREGFEPSMGYQPIHTFQACSFGRSDTSPKVEATHQPHPGTRVRCCRCSLPGLTGFTTCRREGTGGVTIVAGGYRSQRAVNVASEGGSGVRTVSTGSYIGVR